MAHLFGTDGVRGIANVELTCKLAYELGQAAVAVLGHTIVIGKDTRKSGDMLEAAVVAGITSVGGNALLVDVLPTPGVALMVRYLLADGGIVISASHNPPEYNGIKFFDARGYKLSEELEEQIEAFVSRCPIPSCDLPVGDGLGVAIPVDSASEIYVSHAVKSVESQKIDFAGFKIALDVGYGAAALTSANALEKLGAEVVVINEEFDGNNINVECGSTHLAPLRKLVLETGADVGIAHDGDADRVIMMDQQGNELDGDVIEAVCAIDLKEQGKLVGNKVVSTVMCNLGFMQAMKKHNIEVIQTAVGDRYVLEVMREQGLSLGGEQSGHMIFHEYNTTGDGLVTACQFLAACRRKDKPVNEVASVMRKFPQTLINVHVANKTMLAGNQEIGQEIKRAEDELGESGRILVRPSGTEPLIRVMVEASDVKTAHSVAQRIASLIEAELSVNLN